MPARTFVRAGQGKTPAVRQTGERRLQTGAQDAILPHIRKDIASRLLL